MPDWSSGPAWTISHREEHQVKYEVEILNKLVGVTRGYSCCEESKAFFQASVGVGEGPVVTGGEVLD